MASAPQQTSRAISSGILGRVLLALLLAFGFWAWVTNNNNPDRSRPFDTVPITVINAPDGLAVTDYSPQTVTVTIWGPRNIVTDPGLQAGNFAALVDLKDLKPGMHDVAVHVQTTVKDLRKKSAEPTMVSVRIEQSIDKAMSVTLPAPSQPGVKVNSIMAAPSEVRVSGPESKVNAVTQVAVALDFGDRTAAFQTTVDLKPLDASGREITGVTLTPPRVLVVADLTDLRNERVVPVNTADVTGAPAPGFRLDTIVATPNQVTLTGDPQVIRTVANIPTQTISIDGLNQSKMLTVPLDTSKLPPGVSIKNNLTSVNVQISIVEVTQDIAYQVPIQPVNLKPGLQWSPSQREATITLRGTRQQLDQITGTSILALANLASFTGPSPAKDVAIEVQLPTGSPVKIVKTEPPSIQVTITAIPTATPNPTATPRPTPIPTPIPSPTATTAP